MFTITEYSVELVKDPFGILAGKRYEFVLDIEVEEDDELFNENELSVRVIYSVQEGKEGIVKYDLLERSTEKYMDFDLEEDEIAEVEAFCKEHYAEAEV